MATAEILESTDVCVDDTSAAETVRQFMQRLLLDGRFIQLCRENPRAAAARLGVELDEATIDAIESQDWGTLVTETVDRMQRESYRSVLLPDSLDVDACGGYLLPICVIIIIDRAAGAVPDDNWIADMPPEKDDRL